MGTATHLPPEVNVALQGTLDTFALPDVLRLLAATKKTGRLRITGGRGTGSVWVVSGEVSAVEATHAPHAAESMSALFELLRFEDGAFTFDAEATHDTAGAPADVEVLLEQSEALLTEWRDIEAVVPSMDAWVSLRKSLPLPEVTIDQDRWTTIVAVGGGATVRRIGDELCLAELPISRAIKELVEAGVVDIGEAPPVTGPLVESGTNTEIAPLVSRSEALLPEAATARPSGPRARRVRTGAAAPSASEAFVPLDLPGMAGPPSYDAADQTKPGLGPEQSAGVDELAAAFPGLAKRTPAATTHDDDSKPTAEDDSTNPSDADADTDADDDKEIADDDKEIAEQLATLSPRAASAIRAAAEAKTDAEREAALDVAEGEDSLNRGLLLKFLSSVKS